MFPLTAAFTSNVIVAVEKIPEYSVKKPYTMYIPIFLRFLTLYLYFLIKYIKLNKQITNSSMFTLKWYICAIKIAIINNIVNDENFLKLLKLYLL